MAKKDIKILAFTVRAPYAFFRIPYATTGAPSYPFPPRTTVIGLVSAILGIRREELWRKDSEYSALFDPMITGVGVKILNLRGSITSALLYGRIKDEKSERKRKMSAIPKIRVKNGELIYEYTQESVVYPTQLLVDPEYRVYITTEEGILEKLYGMIKENKTTYTLYLGNNSMLCRVEDPKIITGEIRHGKTQTPLVVPIRLIPSDYVNNVNKVFRERKVFLGDEEHRELYGIYRIPHGFRVEISNKRFGEKRIPAGIVDIITPLKPGVSLSIEGFYMEPQEKEDLDSDPIVLW